MSKNKNLVYAGMSADLIHKGHINLIKHANKYGRLMIGVLTDQAIENYKRKPILPYKHRKIIVENIKGVDTVVPQNTLSYKNNLIKYKPQYVIHGNDWKKGVQKKTRQEVIECLKEWNGQLIEIQYTKGVSTTDLISRMTKINC